MYFAAANAIFILKLSKDALTSTTKGKLVKVRGMASGEHGETFKACETCRLQLLDAGGSQHELLQLGHPVVDHAAANLPTIRQSPS